MTESLSKLLKRRKISLLSDLVDTEFIRKIRKHSNNITNLVEDSIPRFWIQHLEAEDVIIIFDI